MALRPLQRTGFHWSGFQRGFHDRDTIRACQLRIDTIAVQGFRWLLFSSACGVAWTANHGKVRDGRIALLPALLPRRRMNTSNTQVRPNVSCKQLQIGVQEPNFSPHLAAELLALLRIHARPPRRFATAFQTIPRFRPSVRAVHPANTEATDGGIPAGLFVVLSVRSTSG